MNNIPTNSTPPVTPKGPHGADSGKLRRALRANRAYATLTIVLSILLCLSMALNIALIMSGKSIGGNDSTANDTTLPYHTTSTPVSNTPTVSSSESTSADTTDNPTSSITHEVHDPVELGQLYDMLSTQGMTLLSRVPGVYETLSQLIREENRPKHVDYESASDSASDETSAEATPIYSTSMLSFAYVDLTTGESFGYNAEKPLYTASIIKAPYVYAILREVEEFEDKKRNFADDGTALYDEDGKALFEGDHPNLDADGSIIYKKGEEKYDLSRTWTYNSKTMFEEGSGMIQEKKDGFKLTYLELIEYALKYSDNIAMEQLCNTFGYNYYHETAAELGIRSKAQGFMHLSASDSIKYLCEIYNYFESGSKYAGIMKDAMINSNYGIMIPTAVSPNVCAHKYGWDVDAYHDMGIVYHERPFAVVVMTDLDQGSHADYTYIQKIVKAVLQYHTEKLEATDTDATIGDTQGDINE